MQIKETGKKWRNSWNKNPMATEFGSHTAFLKLEFHYQSKEHRFKDQTMFLYRKDYFLLWELQFQHVYVAKLGVKIQPVACECQGHDSPIPCPTSWPRSHDLSQFCSEQHPGASSVIFPHQCVSSALFFWWSCLSNLDKLFFKRPIYQNSFCVHFIFYPTYSTPDKWWKH